MPDNLLAPQELRTSSDVPSVLGSALGVYGDWWLRGGVSNVLGMSPIPVEQMPAQLALGFGESPGAIRAFHGTPHTFPAEEGAPLGRFSSAAIGSGEGAQAYGWGHYVAGNPKTAETYQGIGKASPSEALLSIERDHPDIFRELGNIANENPWHSKFTVDRLQNLIDYGTAKDHLYLPYDLQQRIFATGVLDKPAGNLLEVHILPDEHELLDWDKPLSEQPEIASKIAGIEPNLRRLDPRYADTLRFPELSGGDAYSLLSRKYGMEMPAGYRTQNDEAASKALHEAGIPGLKYLDAGSRDRYQIIQSVEGFSASRRRPSGDPELDSSPFFSSRAGAEKWADSKATRNYVIFDPSNLRIVGRNGERLIPVEEDPFAGESSR